MFGACRINSALQAYWSDLPCFGATVVIFEKLGVGSLQINCLTLYNYCFSCRNVFQIGINDLTKIDQKGFCQKVQNFVSFGPNDFILYQRV